MECAIPPVVERYNCNRSANFGNRPVMAPEDTSTIAIVEPRNAAYGAASLAGGCYGDIGRCTQDHCRGGEEGEGQFFGIHASNDGRVMIFAGGVPLRRDGKVVGAVGVSGGSGEQDQAVAEAGAKAFG
jgi:uncharacterized protein GlcG (DUF336 family)